VARAAPRSHRLRRRRAFPGPEARQEHLEAGRARLARIPEPLAQPPTIEFTDILAAKIPGTVRRVACVGRMGDNSSRR
jgi:hypothetical protein